MSIENHTIAPGHDTLQLEIPLLLPGVDDARHACIAHLQENLRVQSGIEHVHVERRDNKPVLCLHYDPNLLQLGKLERLAHDEGAAIMLRFKHDVFFVPGMNCASCAARIEHVVRKTPGILTVNVNYPTEKMTVEYDSTQLSRDTIIKSVGKLGYRVLDKSPSLQVLQDNHPHEPDKKRWVHNPELMMSLLSGALLILGFASERLFDLPHGVALFFYLGTYVAGGHNLARHAIPTILNLRFDVEFLMLAAAIGAAFLGNWAEGGFLLFLFSLAHALEHLAMAHARDAIRALGKLTPKVARVRREDTEIIIPTAAVRIDDIAIVRPGDRVAIDGKVLSGTSALDQSPITGESVPVEKELGDEVFAGSINGDGALEVKVTKLAKDTTMARVMKMVEEAQSQKSPTQTFAEKFERIFVPFILVIVVLAAIVPPLLGWLSWPTALLRAISTLVAASPCALALATPAAVLAGIGQAARNGVLIKGGVHLENLGSLNALALDKTGTITRGRPEVSDIIPVDMNEFELLTVAAAVETRSAHSLAQAVVRKAQEMKLELPPVNELQTLQGRGVQSMVGSDLIRIGNARMFEEAEIALPSELKMRLQELGNSGKPTMIIGIGDRVAGVLAMADMVRDEAPAALRHLRDMGIKSLTMLTGDNKRVAHTIAKTVGITEVRADLLPEDKVSAIKQLMQQHGQVAMIGDGVNDAPALANATVGIAMGAGGTDVALETADVALMGDDLSKLPFAVALSRQSRAIIRQNLWIALGVIAILVPSALFGFARLGVAVIFHEGSTLIVVVNALRLLRFKMQ